MPGRDPPSTPRSFIPPQRRLVRSSLSKRVAHRNIRLGARAGRSKGGPRFRLRTNSRSEVAFGVVVYEVHIAALHPPRQEHSISVLHQVEEPLTRSLHDRVV